MFFTKPWKHHILDNFFDDDTLKYCHNLIKSSSLKQNNHTVLKDKRLLSYFNKAFDETFIKNNFDGHRDFNYLEPVGDINLSNNKIWVIPLDTDNTDYHKIQEWAKIEGNNIIDNGA